jgi:undecaprenyl diphosphate synthase
MPNTNLHIGIIPDGNRRFAINHGIDLSEGYLRGIARVDEILHAITNRDPVLSRIKMLTLYICSVDNVTKRSTREIKKLTDLVRSQLERYQEERSLIHQHEVRVTVIGDLSYFPDDLRELAKGIQSTTMSYSQYKINLAIGYNAIQEIQDAVRRMPNPSYPLTSYLSLQREMDLVIRTGAEKRISGFFPLMTLHSELFFLDKMWPEFELDDLRRIIEEFDQRDRRFGR